jgi:hypothetical protein
MRTANSPDSHGEKLAQADVLRGQARSAYNAGHFRNQEGKSRVTPLGSLWQEGKEQICLKRNRIAT